MIKKIQEINLTSNKSRKGKSVIPKHHMPLVRCVCGCEILVVPDLKAMNLAITRHVTEHKKKHVDSEALREYLSEQILIVASKHKSFNWNLGCWLNASSFCRFWVSIMFYSETLIDLLYTQNNNSLFPLF
jgi:hypothetical protein